MPCLYFKLNGKDGLHFIDHKFRFEWVSISKRFPMYITHKPALPNQWPKSTVENASHEIFIEQESVASRGLGVLQVYLYQCEFFA